MSPDLIAFLKAWHDWATNGAPEGEPFSRSLGLCPNAAQFGGAVLYDKIVGCFPEDRTPFGRTDYFERWSTRTLHLCPKRLAWVRERLIEAGELVA